MEISLPSSTVSRIEGADALARLVEPWRRLASERPQNRPFSSPGFVMAALEAYHGNDAPFVLAVHRGDTLDGVLPLVNRPFSRFGYVVREIGFPRNPNTILNDPLFPGEDPARRGAVAAVIRCLSQYRARSLILDNLPRSSGIAQDFVDVARAEGFTTDGLEPARSLYFIRLDGSYDDYLASRSGEHRWQIKKIFRKAAGAGEVSVERHGDRQSIRAMLPDWFAVERRSWQGATPGAAMTEADRRFMALLLDHLDDDEVGDLWILRAGERPVAALRMLGGGGRTCVHTMHYDQEYRHLTPGTILLARMLQSAFERRLDEVDLHGSTDYFRRWATDAREHVRVRLYAPGLYGRILRQGRAIARRFDRPQAPAPAPT